jgi:Ca2+-binding RTX toxin-like protein
MANITETTRDEILQDASLDGTIDGGTDTMDGGFGSSVLEGSYGNKLFEFELVNVGPQYVDRYGSNGNDTLYGSDFNDRIYGQEGNDQLYGLRGNDRYHC